MSSAPPSPTASAAHPTLRDPELLGRAAAAWQANGYLRLAPVLAPGLAAELAHVLSLVPARAVLDDTRAELAWRGEVVLPDHHEVQHAPVLWRLVQWLTQDLPPVLRAITGEDLVVDSPRRWWVTAHRKGSFSELLPCPQAPPAGTWRLGLSRGEWPQAWGGYREFFDPADRPLVAFPPGWDSLDLVAGRLRDRVSLVERQVERFSLGGQLTHAEEA